MRIPIDGFWDAAERWHSSTPKPRIVVECNSGGNWPERPVKGTVEQLLRGNSITFTLEDGESWALKLEGCTLQAVSIPRHLSEMEIAAKFSLRRDEDHGGTSTFVFLELRDFGKPN